MTTSQPAATDELAAVDHLIQAGRLAEAVDQLAAVNRRHPDGALEIRLRDLRARAAAAWPSGPGRTPWPPAYDDPFPSAQGRMPDIGVAELTTAVLGGAVAHHGALIVRSVLGAAQVAEQVDAIDRIHHIRRSPPAPDAASEPDVARWFDPLRNPRRPDDAVLRKLGHDLGGTWLADSPATTALVLDSLDGAGVTRAVAGHLGERPFFSLQKSTLRRTLPTYNPVSWHQDGAFLGDGVRTIDVWVALSRCGGDLPTPGLELVPQRLDHIIRAEGGMVPNSVPDGVVQQLAAETPTVVPEFEPGDAIIFDERFLHRTYLTEGMTDIRYALECWYFAPSHQSPSYTPLLV